VSLRLPSKIVELMVTLLNRLTDGRLSNLENLDTPVSNLDNNLAILRSGFDNTILKAFKTFSLEALCPVDEINLYTEIPSDSTEDTVLQVISGSGTETWTTKYVPDNHIAWIESMGLEAEFSTTPDITWNTSSAKYIRLQRKFHDRQGNTITSEAKWGGSTTNEMWNWRSIVALSEQTRYVTGFKKDQKDHFRADFVAQGNLHYWFLNQKGDEYIKLVADAGIFSYTDDTPALYIHGLIYDLADIQQMT